MLRLLPHRLELKYLVIAAVLVGGLIALNRIDALSGLDHAITDALTTTEGLGVIGIFLVALIANCVVFIQIPYTLPVLSAALGGASLGEMVGLGVAAGIGAGIGEMIKYTVADQVLVRKRDLDQSPLYRWVFRQVRERPKVVKWIVLVWAGSILPDDTVVIPLAMVRYGLRRIAAPLLLGKVVHNVLTALVFYAFTDWADRHVSSGLQVDVALGVMIAFMLLILYQIEKVRSSGRQPSGRQLPDDQQVDDEREQAGSELGHDVPGRDLGPAAPGVPSADEEADDRDVVPGQHQLPASAPAPPA